jgi:MurNAc alpha-1-phosphate uridylyltransferase
VLVDNPDHHPNGDFYLDTAGRVHPTGAPRLTYGGLALLDPALVAEQADDAFALAPLLRAAMERGRVAGHHHRGAWVDVGTPARLESLDRTLRAASGPG